MTKTLPELPLFSYFDTKKKILCGMQVPSFIWISSNKDMVRCDVITAFLGYEGHKLALFKDFILNVQKYLRIVKYNEMNHKDTEGVYLIVCSSNTPSYIKEAIRGFSNLHNKLSVGGYKSLDTKEEYFDYVKGAMIEEFKQCLLVSVTDHEFPVGCPTEDIPVISTLREVKKREDNDLNEVHDLVFEIEDWYPDKTKMGPYVKLSTDKDEDLLFGPNSPNFILARCTEKEMELTDELKESWDKLRIKVDWSDTPKLITIATKES